MILYLIVLTYYSCITSIKLKSEGTKGVARLEMKCTQKNPRGLGATVRPSLGPGQSPVGGEGDEAPGSSRILANLFLK